METIESDLEQSTNSVLNGTNQLTDEEKRAGRKLRQEFSELTKSVQDNKERLLRPDCEDLIDNVKHCNELFDKVKTVREGAMDAKFMALSVSIGYQKAAQLQTDLVSFKAIDFIENLITAMGGSRFGDENEEVTITEEGWESLANPCSECFTSVVPALHPMLGVCNIGPRVAKPNRQQKQTANDQTKNTQPTHVTDFKKNEKEATPEEIERVLGVIRSIYKHDPTPIDFFELVVNPLSFGQTVENIFHLAFLVKDGLVKIELNDDGIPVVEPIQNVNTNGIPNKASTNQVMIALTMAEWRDIIDAYELQGKQPYIHPRNNKKKSKK